MKNDFKKLLFLAFVLMTTNKSISQVNASKNILVIENDTTYIESNELQPQFKNADFPDFHIFIQKYVKNAYSGGELFTYATFTIHPSGKIDDITIRHHVSKSYDAKIIKAIKASKGMWTLPKLNNEKIAILKMYEDRDIMPRTTDLYDFTPLKFKKYSREYINNFRVVARNLVNEDYQKALEYISKCDDIIPNEANLFYLKYLCYTKLGKLEMSNRNLELLKKSKLKYLIE